MRAFTATEKLRNRWVPWWYVYCVYLHVYKIADTCMTYLTSTRWKHSVCSFTNQKTTEIENWDFENCKCGAWGRKVKVNVYVDFLACNFIEIFWKHLVRFFQKLSKSTFSEEHHKIVLLDTFDSTCFLKEKLQKYSDPTTKFWLFWIGFPLVVRGEEDK